MTVHRGNVFERKVSGVLKANLENGGFGLDPKLVKIYSKKRYWSKDRESDIVTDISMELWLPNAAKYSLLLVFECKDYRHPVPVDDVEEFKAKPDQIAGKNVKGILVTSGILQKSALKYAESNGISVVRMLPEEKITWVAYHRPSKGYVIVPSNGMTLDDYKYSLFLEFLDSDYEIESYDYDEGSDFEDEEEESVDPHELYCALTMENFCVESREFVGFCNRMVFGTLSNLIREAITL